MVARSDLIRLTMNDNQTKFRAVSQALQALHRDLIAIAEREHERRNGPVATRVALLQLLMSDPEFAWLREVSELIVNIDHLAASELASTVEAGGDVRRAVERLLTPPADPGTAQGFAARYFPLLPNHAEIAMGHASIKRIIQELPPPVEHDKADLLHESHKYTAARRHRTKGESGPS